MIIFVNGSCVLEILSYRGTGKLHDDIHSYRLVARIKESKYQIYGAQFGHNIGTDI